MNEIIINSYEVEKLEQLILEKKKDFERPKPDFVQKKLQSEILFLENEVLPIVRNETMLLFSEMTKYLNNKISEAVKQDANLLVLLIPLSQSKDNTLKIATVNPHRDNPIEGIEIEIYSPDRQIEEVQ